jgi:hypothetical protein
MQPRRDFKKFSKFQNLPKNTRPKLAECRAQYFQLKAALAASLVSRWQA